MNMLKRIVNTAILFAMLSPFPAWAQQAAGSSLGTVTALQGQATVGRAALPQPTPMKFRDDVFFRDQITTKEQSTLRLLLGGKGVLTIREQSQVTLDESVAPTGERRSVLNLLGGKIAAAIARSLMRPGEEVEIRTPNAVAAVRGTVLIAEYIPPQTSAEAPKPILLASGDPTFRVAQATTPAAGQTTFLVLTGSVTVTAQGAPPVTVGAMQTVSISVGPAGVVQVGAVQTATQGQVAQATQGLQMEKSISGQGDGGNAAQAQAQVAATLTNAIVQATSAASAPPAPSVQQPASTPVPDATQTPPLPTTTPQNALPSGPLLQLNALIMTVPTGTTVMTFGPGSANAVVPIGVTGTGMESTVIALPAAGAFDITGNPITHSGPLLGLSAAVLGANDINTPLMQVNGTTFTATASGTTGALATVEGGSLLYVGGAMFLFAGGGTTNLSGAALSISGQSVVAAGGVLFNIQGKSTVNTSGGPLVRITDGRLTTSDFGSSDGTGNHITIGGGLLDATNSFIELTGQSNNNDQGDKTVMAQPAGVPQIRLTSSALSMGYGLAAGPTGSSNNSVVDFGGGTSTFDGLLLIATDSEIFMVGGDLLGVNSGTVSTTEASVPLIQLTNTSVDNTMSEGLGVGGKDLLYVGGTASLTLAGPFMSATGGSITTSGSLLHLDGPATLTATTSQPLFQFTNVTFDSSTNANFAQSIFALNGGASLRLAGPLLSASGGTIDGNGPLLRMDTALLNAANATIFQMTGGSLTSNKTDTSGSIYLYNSQVTAVQVANLNNSQIQITNGPLLNVTGGSQMTITGDLATLANGARITVSNGPLIAVDGAASKLTVNGALAKFVGSGNQVIVTNALMPNLMLGTVPVVPVFTDSLGTASTNIVVGPYPVKNPAGGTLSVTGSLLKVTNGGRVNVAAPAP